MPIGIRVTYPAPHGLRNLIIGTTYRHENCALLMAYIVIIIIIYNEYVFKIINRSFNIVVYICHQGNWI